MKIRRIENFLEQIFSVDQKLKEIQKLDVSKIDRVDLSGDFDYDKDPEWFRDDVLKTIYEAMNHREALRRIKRRSRRMTIVSKLFGQEYIRIYPDRKSWYNADMIEESANLSYAWLKKYGLVNGGEK